MAAASSSKISGRGADARFSFINDTYEPLSMQHNDRPVFVARGVAPRYLYHSGKDRWVVSKTIDDGSKCWAFVAAGSSRSPSECPGPWTVCDGDGEWRADPKVQCTAVPASTDKFVQLRLTLDDDMRQYGLVEKSDLRKLWRRLDYNNNGVVSLAEIDKMVVDLVAASVWPSWVNSKPALMRAYKKTVLNDCPGDEWVQKAEFHALLLNIFWFNKLWQVFNAVDTGADRRIDVREFIAGMSQLGLNLAPQEALSEFSKMDTNSGGQVLFVEMCAYVRRRVNPDDDPAFDADIISGEHCEAASYSKVHSRPPSRAITARAPSRGAPRIAPGLGENPRISHQTALRSCGLQASLTHMVKQKALSDFDDLESTIKAICQDPARIKEMWTRMDFNGNNILSLAEIDKWVVEVYPLLNHKPALMRCYKQTIGAGSLHDGWVHARDFKKLLVNLFYFNKLYWIFDQCEGDDRRLTFQEFKMVYALCGCPAAEAEAQRDFRACDRDGGGMVLFDEFCQFFAGKACPQGMVDLVGTGAGPAGARGTSPPGGPRRRC